MSVYSRNKKWTYDFVHQGKRYCAPCPHETKSKAAEKMLERRRGLKETGRDPVEQIPTDMVFSELVNLRLDDLQDRFSRKHYQDARYLAKRWVAQWGYLQCGQITRAMVKRFLKWRKDAVSVYAANKDLRHLRALFRWAMREKVVTLSENPVAEVKAYPTKKAEVYVPTQEDIDRLISAVKADKYLKGRHPDTEDYLWVMRDCFARSIEINRLCWKDVSFEGQGKITLTSYKSKGSNERKRTLPKTSELRQRLWNRYQHRDPEIPWIFWHEHTYRKGPRKGQTVRKPYEDRSSFMRTLCRKAGVKYFRFHPLRHAGASELASAGVAPNVIQEMLGHSNLKTTERYLHSVKGAVRDAVVAYEKSRSKFTTDSRQVVPFGKVETR